ncbi:hypothetical protein BJ741DRAFT_715989 [Chytriomyces cf. hyalinus JEL632]|nr:hypothetical protein BJ741DRAFT_715989 [Chytriomyces cf. hyalinus JEL632]
MLGPGQGARIVKNLTDEDPARIQYALSINHAVHPPQIAPLVPHAHLPISDAVTVTDEERLLHATYPILNPALQGHFNSIDPTHKSNPIIVDDEDVLADIAINTRKLVKAYPVQWGNSENKKMLVDEVIQPQKEHEYSENEFLRVTRLANAVLPLHATLLNSCRDSLKCDRIHAQVDTTTACVKHTTLEWPEGFGSYGQESEFASENSDALSTMDTECSGIGTQVHPVHAASLMLNEHTHAVASRIDSQPTKTYVVEWYVSFSDQDVFQFHEAPSNFSSEEINTLQHPVLGNLKLCLKDLAQNRLPYKPTSGHPSPIIPDDIHFYLQKDKSNNTLCTEELFPISRDLASRCTPILFMGIPMLASINLKNHYGKAYLSEKKYAMTLVESTLPLPASTAPSLRHRPYNNIISMSAPDRLANPQRPCVGAYTLYHIRHIFRTAYTAFRGAVMKSKTTWECLKREAATKDTVALAVGCGGGVSGTQRLEVAVHTGDWGTGEFQNNPTVMAFCQIAAAYAAGVDHLYYHVPKVGSAESQAAMEHIEIAKNWVDDAWQLNAAGEPALLEDVFRYLQEKELKWGGEKKLAQTSVKKSIERVGSTDFIVGIPAACEEYEVISHVWGKVEMMTVCERRLLLNANMLKRSLLFGILLESQRRKSPFKPKAPVWMDIVSIDQNSEADKSAQVNVMHLIYAKASVTHIVIEDRGNFAQLIDGIVSSIRECEAVVNGVHEGLASSAETNPTITTAKVYGGIPERIAGLCTLLDNLMAGTEYMSRVWTAQELILSRNKKFYAYASAQRGWIVLSASYLTSVFMTLCAKEETFSGTERVFFSGYVSALAASIVSLFGPAAFSDLLAACAINHPPVLHVYAKCATSAVTGSSLLNDATGWLDLIAHAHSPKLLMATWEGYDPANAPQRNYLVNESNGFECGGYTYSSSLAFDSAFGTQRLASRTEDYWWAVGRLIGLQLTWSYTLAVEKQLELWIQLLIENGFLNLAEWGKAPLDAHQTQRWAYKYEMKPIGSEETTRDNVERVRVRLLETKQNPWTKGLRLTWNRTDSVFEMKLPKNLLAERGTVLKVRVAETLVFFSRAGTRLHVTAASAKGMFSSHVDVDLDEWGESEWLESSDTYTIA